MAEVLIRADCDPDGHILQLCKSEFDCIWMMHSRLYIQIHNIQKITTQEGGTKLQWYLRETIKNISNIVKLM